MVNIEEFIREENRGTALKVAEGIRVVSKEVGIVRSDEEVRTLAVGFSAFVLYDIIESFYSTFSSRLNEDSVRLLLDLFFSITEGLGIRQRFLSFYEANAGYSLNGEAVKFSEMISDDGRKDKIASLFIHLEDIIKKESETVGDSVGCLLYLIKEFELERDLVSVALLAFEAFERRTGISVFEYIEQLVFRNKA